MQKKLRVLLFANENSQFSKLHLLKLLVQAQVELIGIITNHNSSHTDNQSSIQNLDNLT